jgi:uncharacterized protein YjiS (DUF1127 family)
MTIQNLTNAETASTTRGRYNTHELSVAVAIGRWIARAWRIPSLWNQRRKDRLVLRSFSPRDIHDFCPRHTEAEAEMNKPFWRA